jgi:hypothetical protein
MMKTSSALLTALIFISLSSPFSFADQLSSRKESTAVFREALKDLETSGRDRDAFMLASNQPTAYEQPADRPSAALPAPSGKSKTMDDIYERGRSSYNIHPFITLTEYYSDNIFNTLDFKKSDYSTRLSPGIWLAFPWIKEAGIFTPTNTGSPSGRSATNFPARYPGHLKTYVMYQADIERYARNSSANTTSHFLEGMLQYNFRGGLSMDISDQFKKSYNERGTGARLGLDKFNANFFNTVLSYEVGDRGMLRIDYSNYGLHYTALRNDFRDRSSNAITGSIFYKLRPRLAAFGSYEYIKVNYAWDTLSDSREHNLFGGLRWDITSKSRGSLKVGYGIKDFEDPAIKNNNNLLFEAQLDHMFTPKTSVALIASRKTNESDVAPANAIVSDSISAIFTKRLATRINGFINLAYINDTYQSDVTFGPETKKLRDRYYKGGVTLQYEFREWLKFDAGYMRSKRDSSFPIYDYTNNTLFFRITGSL